MKIIKNLAIAFAAILILILIIALFAPKEMVYEKSIYINAPIETVWENTNSLKDMDKWNPWNDKDPDMKQESSGIDGTVGAVLSWDSDNKNVGKGKQTITNIVAPILFETELVFYTPYESEADGYVKLVAEEDGTNATWGFLSVMPYPVNITSLFMNMENMMGDDFILGLSRLKAISEAEVVVEDPIIPVIE